MPVAVAPGNPVEAGQALVVIEAMKMEHTVTASTNGVISEVRVSPGRQVEGGAVLVVIDAAAG